MDIDEPAHFLQVLSQIEASSCRLLNPMEAVRWNIDKNYLFDLEKSGTPIVPTYLASSFNPVTLQDMFLKRQWQTAILKPTLGGAGVNSHRIASNEISSKLGELKTQQQQQYLMQPFVESVITEGEWSFIFFNRKLSHVMLKKPAPKDYRVQGIYGGTVEIAEPQPRDILQAEAIMNRLPFDLVYARLDLVRVEGELSVMEVELIEPILSFNLFPAGVERLVNAARTALGEP